MLGVGSEKPEMIPRLSRIIARASLEELSEKRPVSQCDAPRLYHAGERHTRMVSVLLVRLLQ